MDNLEKEINEAYKKAGDNAYFGNGYKMGYESAKNKQQSINWQPFDPDNPPTDKGVKYLIESNQGFFMIATRQFEGHFNSNDCLFNFKHIKAYAIINPST